MRTLRLTATTIMSVFISGCATDHSLSEDDAPAIAGSASLPPSDQPRGTWIHEPLSYPGTVDGSQISNKTYWQTQITKLPMAVRKLENKTIVGLSDDEARYYAGPHYRKQTGTRPFLVRAVFSNYTGDFELFSRGGDLYVSHFSLGHISGETKLPLVINLKRAPNRVYTYMRSAL